MRHQFSGDTCVFCGMNLRITGYSAKCPVASNKVGVAERRAPTVEKHVLRTKCYRCSESIIPKIVRETTSSGGIGVPIAGRIVFRSNEETRSRLECPVCGAPFPDDEMIRKLNGESDGEPSSVFWKYFIIVAVAAVIALIISVVLGTS